LLNPANNSLTVSVNDDNANTSYSSFDEVRIYDQQGNLKTYQKFNKVSLATINVKDLFNGTYIVEISSAGYKERQQLIIQK
jgi:hypothetical protein